MSVLYSIFRWYHRRRLSVAAVFCWWWTDWMKRKRFDLSVHQCSAITAVIVTLTFLLFYVVGRSIFGPDPLNLRDSSVPSLVVHGQTQDRTVFHSLIDREKRAKYIRATFLLGPSWFDSVAPCNISESAQIERYSSTIIITSIIQELWFIIHYSWYHNSSRKYYCIIIATLFCRHDHY